MSAIIDYMPLGPLQANCYLIINSETKDTVVVDPGGDFEHLDAYMIKNGFKPAAIVLTHAHFDHMMAVNALKKKYDISLYVHEKETRVLEDPQLNLTGLFMNGSGIALKADHTVKDGEYLEIAGLKMKVIYTPGHTIGGMCLYLEDEKLLISGDTLFQGSVGRTDFPTGSTQQLIQSIRENLLILGEDVIVYPGHGSLTTIGYEKKFNCFVN